MEQSDWSECYNHGTILISTYKVDGVRCARFTQKVQKIYCTFVEKDCTDLRVRHLCGSALRLIGIGVPGKALRVVSPRICMHAEEKLFKFSCTSSNRCICTCMTHTYMYLYVFL